MRVVPQHALHASYVAIYTMRRPRLLTPSSIEKFYIFQKWERKKKTMPIMQKGLIQLSKFLDRFHISLIRNTTLQCTVSLHFKSLYPSPSPVAPRISRIVTGFAHETFETLFLCPILIGADVGEVRRAETSTGRILRMGKSDSNPVYTASPI